MKGPFALVMAATLLVGATFSGEAWAQKKRIVVEAFKGPAADKYRIAVMKSLYAAGFEVIPDKTLVKVEADLGLRKVADSYGGIARELKLSGYVSGIITGGRRPKARVIVRNPDGKPIGGKIFQATSAPKLMAMVAGGAGTKTAEVLGGASGGGGLPSVAEPASDPVAAAEEDDKPRKRRGRQEEPEPAKEETTEEPAAAGEDASVSAEAEETEMPSKSKSASGRNLRLAFVLRTFSRNFQYNQSKVGKNQGYTAPAPNYNSLPLVPAPGVAVDFFPASFFGLHGAYNKAIIGSKDTAGSVYTTSSYSYLFGAKGRLPVAMLEIEPGLSYGANVFEITNFKGDPTRIQVAPVDYRTIRVGSDVRVPMSSGASFSVGAHYLHILSAGAILDEKKDWFKGSAVGGELSAGLILPLVKGFDLGVGVDFRRIAFAFTPNLQAKRIAGGAIDQYIGLNLGVGYNIGM